ncbi:Protein of unknown function DUF3632 [Penicillium expansum]|uniref:Uncharacterized protein n=1 Tax=Penicillium expansum TaxID=27334 RepID=A0A0A2L0E4_PENEN|nr:Protein of unknown function DUF3632 [Penicillium expansum]KGO45079.1 Protein of unknown function DUF3632 [Penicillium expansum]KGO52214.1 Protein of unknown function DUF3632 [Penicillium expansum]KGO73519.1 Protein of unknown function DUF3632 [Penicillium expansum]
MHDLLKDSPRDTPHAFAVNTPSDLAGVEEAARAGDFDVLRSVTYNRVWYMGQSYCASRESIDSCEPTLHSLWYVYCQCAKHVSYESFEQDKWILDILRTRGRGPLTRPAPGGGIDIARTTNGTVWNDLPFLATDMTEFWINNCAEMDSKQRLNAATFLAKLASTRVANDQLCQIALLLFRETFEAERPLGSSNESDAEKEDSQRSIDFLRIASLLPSACAWIREAGQNLILLSDFSWNDCSHSTIATCGFIFTQSELGQRAPSGFSPWRWLYWLKRLHQIADEASKADEMILAEQAAQAIDIMLSNVKERNSRIVRVFEAAGDAVTQDKDFMGLKKKW